MKNETKQNGQKSEYRLNQARSGALLCWGATNSLALSNCEHRSSVSVEKKRKTIFEIGISWSEWSFMPWKHVNYVPDRFFGYVDHHQVGSVVTAVDLTRKLGTISKENALNDSWVMTVFKLTTNFRCRHYYLLLMTKLCSDVKLHKYSV